MNIIKTILLLVLFQTAALAQRPTAYSLKVGDLFRITTEASQDISQTVMGQTQNTQQTTTNVDDYEVIGLDNSIYTIKTTSIKRKVEMSSPMGDMVMDSELEGGQNAVMGALSNQSYQFKMNKFGEILEIEGLEEMLKSLREDLNASGLGGQADEILSSYQGETLKSTLSQQFNFYEPDMSDSWNKSNTLVVMGTPITTNSTFKWEGNNIINGASDVEMQGEMEQMGMMMKMDISGIQQTKTTLDESTGMPTEVVLDQDMAGNVEAQGMTIPMTINSKTITTFIKQK